jgi:hypothetical protein
MPLFRCGLRIARNPLDYAPDAFPLVEANSRRTRRAYAALKETGDGLARPHPAGIEIGVFVAAAAVDRARLVDDRDVGARADGRVELRQRLLRPDIETARRLLDALAH